MRFVVRAEERVDVVYVLKVSSSWCYTKILRILLIIARLKFRILDIGYR